MSLIILNFHGVGPVPRDIDDGERNCWLDQDFFESVLDLTVGQPHVRLTVDDGNASDFEIILPALVRRGLVATFFVCSDRLDQPTFLPSSQVRELRAKGMGIGSHGAAHRSWRRLSAPQLEAELGGSRRALENICAAPVEEAACPFGDYDRDVLTALRQAGYRAVYTSDRGLASERQWLRARTSVTRKMSLADVRRVIDQGSFSVSQSLLNARKLFKRLRS